MALLYAWVRKWVDYVREDVQLAGLSFTWQSRFQDRAGWGAAIECLLRIAQTKEVPLFIVHATNLICRLEGV